MDYLTETITAQTIRDDADYAGVRISMDCPCPQRRSSSDTVHALADTEPVVFGRDAIRALVAERVAREAGDRPARPLRMPWAGVSSRGRP